MSRVPHLVLVALCVVFFGTACATRTQHTSVGGVDVLTVRQEYNNTHVVTVDGRTDARILIDGGLEPDVDALIERLDAEGVTGVVAVLATHAHADHIGGTRALADHFDAPLVLGAGDVELAGAGAHVPEEMCAVGAIARSRAKKDVSMTWTPTTADVVAPDTLSTDPEAGTPLETLVGEGVPGTLFAIPSHTPGSVGLRVGDAVFVGDLLRGSITGRGARRHFYICDLPANDADIDRVLQTGATVWFPGHFGPLKRKKVEAFHRRQTGR